jgi:hypothetical protein
MDEEKELMSGCGSIAFVPEPVLATYYLSNLLSWKHISPCSVLVAQSQFESFPSYFHCAE